MSRNNLFAYAPKELSTDAFLCWLFKECAGGLASRSPSQGVLEVLCGARPGVPVAHVECQLQHGRTDLIVRITQGSDTVTTLYENKTWSTIGDQQLGRYRSAFPDCDRYVFLKLGLIAEHERRTAETHGYEVVDARTVMDAISPLEGAHPIVDMYLEYLRKEFVEYGNDLQRRMAANDPAVYEHGDAQRMFLSSLMRSLDGVAPWMEFNMGVGKGSGRPWTHLAFYRRERAYGEIDEYLFFRIDVRSGRTYLRLCQYADIDEAARDAKNTRLEQIRQVCRIATCGTGLVIGAVHDRARKESEALILFFDENKYDVLRSVIPNLTRHIIEGMDRLDG